MAHTYVNKSQENGVSGNPETHTHTPGSAATVIILSIVVVGTTARAGGAPTIGGTTAIQADSTRSSSENLVEVWYLCGNFSGSGVDISIPNTGGRTLHIEVISAYAGSGYSSAYNHANGVEYQAGTEDGGSLGVNTNALGDFCYWRMVNGEAATGSVIPTFPMTGGTTSYANDHGAYTSFGYYGVADTVGTETMSWTWTNDVAAIVGVCFKSIASTQVNATKQSLTLTKYNATIKADKNITATKQSLSMTKYNSTVQYNKKVDVSATKQSLSLTKYNPTATYNKRVQVDATKQSLALTKYNAAVKANVNISATKQSLSMTKYNSTATYGMNVNATLKALVLSGKTASINKATGVNVGVDPLTLSQKNATVDISGGINVSATRDELILTKYQSDVSYDVYVDALLKALTLSPKNPSVSFGGGINVNALCVSLILSEEAATVTFQLPQEIITPNKIYNLEWDTMIHKMRKKMIPRRI